MNYHEEYMEDPEPSSISYEIYQSDIIQRDNKIEELEKKVEDLECEIDDSKKIISYLKGELKRYEKIFKSNHISM